MLNGSALLSQLSGGPTAFGRPMYLPTEKRLKRTLVRLAATLLVVGALGEIISPAGAYGAVLAPAHVARALRASDKAHLSFVPSSGSLILEEGRAQGTLPGRVRAYIGLVPTVAGTKVVAKFTIYAQGGGSISGRGEALLKGQLAEPSFGSRFVITGGSGRFARARGSGGFFGVLVRRTMALTVQTTGKLYY